MQTEIQTFADPSKLKYDDVVWDVVYFSVAALSLGISVVTWFNAFRGKSDAKKLIEEIKKRPSLPVA